MHKASQDNIYSQVRLEFPIQDITSYWRLGLDNIIISWPGAIKILILGDILTIFFLLC